MTDIPLPKGISRHPNGFLIRIYRNGKTISRFIGKNAKFPRAQTIHVLSKLLSDYPKVEKPPFRLKPQKNNKTGVSGISLTSGFSKRTKKRMPAYSVHFKKNGKPNNKKFYFSAYDGDWKKAFQEAISFRRSYEDHARRQDKEMKP